MLIPKRLMGYGAYNLCFDKEWGKNVASDHRDFFEYMHEGKWHVNLVKVIIFRNAALELEGLAPRRLTTLYNGNQQVNMVFLKHLNDMVRRAESLGIWVQVCIFSYHSVVGSEEPENVPAAMAPPPRTKNNCERLMEWFNPAPTDDTGRERLKQQRDLVTTLGQTLKNYGNVLWELVNEVRVDEKKKHGTCDARTMRAGDCQLLAWLNLMREQLLQALSPGNVYISTSTGVHFDQPNADPPIIGNEPITFSKKPPACRGVAPLEATFFDFHAGQWNARGDFRSGIRAAKQRAHAYNSSAPLIINDDGSRLKDENEQHPEFWELAQAQAAATIKEWATTAFQEGLSFSSKQQYPPLPYDTYALNAMKEAWEAVPIAR